MSVAEHRKTAVATVACSVLTISDTRNRETDVSGNTIAALLDSAGHLVVHRDLLKDDAAAVRAAVAAQIGQVDAVITTGGTGLTSRDSTYEAVCTLLEKRIDGFGELFRSLSFQDIGTAAMLSRAVAGSARHTAIFMLPGSEHAVRLAMTRLILPEIGHVIRELRR